MTELSVIVPVFDCEDCLEELHRRLVTTLDAAVGEDGYEILLIDDRSADGSWDVAQQIASGDRRVRAIRLSRNFGQNAAILAGLERSAGRWTVVIDCDLQDPPELIEALLDSGRAGSDVVFAVRTRADQSWLRATAARAYLKVLKLAVDADLDAEVGEFSLISTRAREELLRLRDVRRDYRLSLLWLGFNRSSVQFERAPRFAGRSSYGPRSLMRSAADGIFFQTGTFLRWVMYLGFAIAAAGGLLALFYLVSFFRGNYGFRGYTTITVLILLVGGFTIICVGVTGLYIEKIFEQVKQRPIYVVDDESGSAGRVDRDQQHAS
jgi:dolichol-phosphate mannosyltransferase